MKRKRLGKASLGIYRKAFLLTVLSPPQLNLLSLVCTLSLNPPKANTDRTKKEGH